MGIEFVLCLEVPPDQADCEFGEIARHGVVEAAIFAELLGAVGKLRPAQQRIEGATQGAARFGDDGIGDLLLLGRELIQVKRDQTRHEAVSFRRSMLVD